MKLSKLVAYRNLLSQASVMPTLNAADLDMNKLLYLIDQNPQDLDSFKKNIDNHVHVIRQNFMDIEKNIVDLKQQLDAEIIEQEKIWFQNSYNLYDQEMLNETTDYILNRRQGLDSESLEILQTRLKNYTDWRFPGLIVRPGLEKFIDSMVSNDPLFLVDQHRDLLKPCMENFSETYQRRLRPYVVNERNSDDILHAIPDGQIGLCLVYNFFNFRPVELIKRWLSEILVKLRPGGILIMTINNCDHEHGVILAENFYACYTPGRLILTLAESLGFEILHVQQVNGALTWIEAKKPGQLESLRGGQTLAKIVSKSIAQSK